MYMLSYTHPGVKIGLQAGSSCCVNLESAIKKRMHLSKKKKKTTPKDKIFFFFFVSERQEF